MTSKQLLLALGELDDHTVAAAHEPMRKVIRRPLRAALIAAAVVALCLTVAWAAVTGYRARFAATREEWRDNFSGDGMHFVIDLDQAATEVNADDEVASLVEAAQELVDRSGASEQYSTSFQRRGEDGKLVETGAGQEWELTMLAERMPSLSSMKQYQRVYYLDVNYLESTLSPVEGTFLCRCQRGDARIWSDWQKDDPKVFTDQTYELQIRGAYRTASGGGFSLMLGYFPWRLWTETWYIGTIPFRDAVKSADGTEFDVVQSGNTILADAIFRHGYVCIRAFDCTWDEVVDQITHLDLGNVPTVFSTGN